MAFDISKSSENEYEEFREFAFNKLLEELNALGFEVTESSCGRVDLSRGDFQLSMMTGGYQRINLDLHISGESIKCVDIYAIPIKIDCSTAFSYYQMSGGIHELFYAMDSRETIHNFMTEALSGLRNKKAEVVSSLDELSNLETEIESWLQT